ncbi:MAG: TetR family transcriptional regulator [Nitrospinaceae bacterium]|nr:MAG: TetR family transcriptional regulator [Nitrospinaceae bacterium]
MPKSGVQTRENILDQAEALILSHGFAGTSIDKVIEKAGITKGAFFYHFKNKTDLAKSLIERFHKKDMAVLRPFMFRAERLSHDPLQQLLIFVGLLSERFDRMTEPFPGCLHAAYVYQSQQFNEEIMGVCTNAMLVWRDLFGDKIRAILEKYQPSQPVDADTLADLLIAILEGSMLLSKTRNDPKVIAPAFNHFRNYLTLLFLQERSI